MGDEKLNVGNNSPREKFFSYIKQKGYSQNFVALQLGVSSPMISAYKQGNYTGDIEKLEKQIVRWLADEERRNKRLTIPILQLNIVDNVRTAINEAVDNRNISVIVGDAGSGKTEAVRYYAAYSNAAVVVEVGPITSQRSLIREIAKQLNIAVSGPPDKMIEIISDELRGAGKVLVVDEADRLDYIKLDMLRRISDSAMCGLVLVGITKFGSQLLNQTADFDQIVSRVGIFLNVNEYRNEENTKGDLKMILDAIKIEYDEVVFDELYKKCKSIRKLCNTLVTSYEDMKRNNEKKLTLDAVNNALSLKLK